MPTVAEVLKQSGMTDEQIAALDAKAVAGFTQVISTAAQTLEAAENAKRLQKEYYENDVAPKLDNWANESASLKAQVAFYKTQADEAKAGGFLAADAPGYVAPTTPAKDATGRFVANAGAVPGSPEFVKVRDELGSAFSFLADTTWKYRSLFGKEMPDSPTTIIAEATAQRMSPSAYAAKKYDFATKEAAIVAETQKKHDDAIRKETADAKDKEWAEKTGSNPNVRQAETSRFSEISQAVQKGERKDTMTMTPEQRRDYTRQQIRKDFAANETVQ